MSLVFDPTQGYEDNNLVDYLDELTECEPLTEEKENEFIEDFMAFKNQALKENKKELLEEQIYGALALFAGNNLPEIFNNLLEIQELDANPWWQPETDEKITGTIEQLFKTNNVLTDVNKKESLELCLKNRHAPELFQYNADDVITKMEERKIILTDTLNTTTNLNIPRKKNWSNDQQNEVIDELEKEYIVIKILEKAGQDFSEEGLSKILNDKSFGEIFEKYKWCRDNSKLSQEHFEDIASLFDKEREQDQETRIEKIHNRSQIVEVVPPTPQKIDRGGTKVHPESQPPGSETKPQPTQEKRSFWDYCCFKDKGR